MGYFIHRWHKKQERELTRYKPRPDTTIVAIAVAVLLWFVNRVL